RLWNESEQTWMGWERKRGKLHELNRLLRGATDTTFLTSDASPARIAGDLSEMREVPGDVRYVITLDSDTRLPRGAVNRLVGARARTRARESMTWTCSRRRWRDGCRRTRC